MKYEIEPTGKRMTFTENCAPNCRLCIGFRLYLLIIGILLWIPGVIFSYHTVWRQTLNIQQWGANLMLGLGCLILILGVAGWILYLWETERDRRKYMHERQKKKEAKRRRRHSRNRPGDVVMTTQNETSNSMPPVETARSTSAIALSTGQVRWSDTHPLPGACGGSDLEYASEVGANSDLGVLGSENSEQFSAGRQPSEGANNSDDDGSDTLSVEMPEDILPRPYFTPPTFPSCSGPGPSYLGEPDLEEIDFEAPDQEEIDSEAPDQEEIDFGAPDQEEIDLGAPDQEEIDFGAPDQEEIDFEAPDQEEIDFGAPVPAPPAPSAQHDQEPMTEIDEITHL